MAFGKYGAKAKQAANMAMNIAAGGSGGIAKAAGAAGLAKSAGKRTASSARSGLRGVRRAGPRPASIVGMGSPAVNARSTLTSSRPVASAVRARPMPGPRSNLPVPYRSRLPVALPPPPPPSVSKRGFGKAGMIAAGAVIAGGTVMGASGHRRRNGVDRGPSSGVNGIATY